MTIIDIRSAHATAPAPGLSGTLTLLLAAGAGMSVASLYYNQPMLPAIDAALGSGRGLTGMVPSLTQLGYAAGILLLAPLGDRFDRRRIMLAKSALLAVALLLSAVAPGIGWLLAASLAVGLTATLAQDMVPAAATLAPPAQSGKAVGTVMTGLLLGILLARLVSGAVAQVAGWRAMFELAAVGAALVGVGVWFGVPVFQPTTRLGYGALLASMARLWREHGTLRRAALAQGLLSVAFSAFWSTLATMLHDQHGLGSGAAGAFGLAGVAGALAAPLAGRLADKRGAQAVTRAGAAVAFVSFAALAALPFLSPTVQLVLLVLAAIGLDFGVQAALVGHQTIVYGLDRAARSRLNALLYTGIFVGMAVGSSVGGLLLAHGGWQAVVMLASAASLAALGVRSIR